jgi:hypothetical protein
MANVTKETPERKETFLEKLRENPNVTQAAKSIRISRKTLYEWRKNDETFAKEWDDAVQDGTDALEDEAVRRALQGTEKPVYQGGKLVGTVREYSDTLLIFLLKGKRPEKYGTDRVKTDGEVTIRVVRE